MDSMPEKLFGFALNKSSTPFSHFQKERIVAPKTHAPSMEVSGNRLVPGQMRKPNEPAIPNNKIQIACH